MTEPVDDIVGLAERCEKATGPDRELDAQLGRYGAAAFLGYVPDEPQLGCQPYTASLDIALTLVPEGKSWRLGCDETFRLMPEHGTYSALIVGGSEGHAATPALALCAAALKARAALTTKDGDGD